MSPCIILLSHSHSLTGKRKMLRKCENKNFPTCVKSLLTMGDRIYAGDMCENFFLVKYNAAEKTLDVLADCINPRFLTSSCLVDFDTIASGDKFGNIAVARLPYARTHAMQRFFFILYFFVLKRKSCLLNGMICWSTLRPVFFPLNLI